MADLEVSKLPVLAGAALQPTDPLPLADLSASETKQITAKDLIQSGIALIDNGSIPGSKINYTTPAGSITELHLADGAVTAAKLRDNSTAVVGAGLPAKGSYIGQLSFNTTTGKVVIWDGGTWQALKAAGSINTVTPDTTGVIQLTAVQTGDVVALNAEPANTTGPSQFLAGPSTGTGGAVGARRIVAEDLPKAGAATLGILSVPPGNGVRINGGPGGLSASLEIDNDVTPSNTARLVTYDRKGLVTGGRALAGTDMPIATQTSLGAVRGGSEFGVTAAGEIKHNNVITPGTGVKITYDGQGHVLAASRLAASDIPGLDGSVLTTGTINPARFGPNTIPKDALNHYSTVLIQEGDPGKGDYIGQLWYKESDAQLRVWSANSWVPVGFGRLSQDNLRFCGTWLADTGAIETLTAFGQQAGFVASAPIPTSTNQMAGAYFVTRHPGTHDGVTYDNGDWILCLGQSQGWVRIDTLSGVAGGGATHLDDLLDVTLTTLNTGDTLIYDAATGIWVNRPTAARKAKFAEAMDGTRTHFTMDVTASSGNNLLISLGGVIQEPGADFSFTAPRTVNFAVPPPAGIDHWVLVEGVPSSASGTSGGGGGGAGSTLPTGTAANEFLQWDNGLATWLPKTLPTASNSVRGTVLLADAADVAAGTAGRMVDAAQLKGFVPPPPPDATDAVKGLVELATAAETATGTDNTRAVTPAGVKGELDKKAPLASPSLTGTPTAPTAAANVNDTQIATTAYVTRAVTTGTTGMLTGVTGTAPIAATVTGGTARVSISSATTSAPGAMSAADKTKLDGIAAGAEVNVQPDWNQADNTKDDFIKNKPAPPADATDAVKGLVELATAAETTTGTDASRAVTPAGLKVELDKKVNLTRLATESTTGIVELASAAETTTGTDNTRAVHPAGLKVELDKKANLASPALTGAPTAPTAPATTNNTQVATTAFVKTAVTGMVTGATGTAPITAATAAGNITVGITAASPTSAGSMSATDKAKLDGIAAGAQVNVQTDWNAAPTAPSGIVNKPASFPPPVATATVLGGVKQGTGLTVAADGTISVSLTGSLSYRGVIDPTTAAPTAPKVGHVYIASAAGAYHPSWGLTGIATKGEMLIFEGTSWDAVGQAQAPLKANWAAAAGAADEILNKPVGTAADQYLRWDQPTSTWVAADDILGGVY